MEDTALLQTCLTVTGKFENGSVAYDHVTGNFDGEGISVGILQWNAGTGSIQVLLNNIASKMGWEKVQGFFHSDIKSFASMSGQDAVAFAQTHYLLTGSTSIAPAAAECWRNLLGQSESIATQQEMAVQGPLAKAKKLVAQYTAAYQDRTRPYAFFFDLVNQSGGMSRRVNGQLVSIPVVLEDQATSWSEALNMAFQKDPKCSAAWQPVLSNGGLSRYLTHYAYERGLWSRAEYMWDTVARRATIAARVGHVHGSNFDFSNLLD